MCRLSELKCLRREDIDLEHETVTIRRAYDREHKREKAPKNGRPRTFCVEPNIVPLLASLADEGSADGRICPVNPYKIADRFYHYLDRAGLTRQELRQGSRTHVRLTMHGLRATGATWAARSKRYGAIELRKILGHVKQESTDVYFDEAQLLGRNVGEVFPVLPASLLARSVTKAKRDDEAGNA